VDKPQECGQAAVIAIPFIYLFTWFYERHFFFALFKADRNAFILTGSQIYILIIALVIAANGVRFRRNASLKSPFWPPSAKR
jgi:hypothetical protein